MFWNKGKEKEFKKEGGFTFKNRGWDENLKQNDFSDMEPFKLKIEYNDKKSKSPKEILYGENSKTRKDNLIKKERDGLLDKLGDKLTPAQILYSSIDDLKKIEEKEKINTNDKFKYDFKKHDELKGILLHQHDKSNKTPLPKGYELLEKYHSDKTGLDVGIYKNDDELILSFPGSKQLKKDYFDTDYKGISKNNKNPQLDEAQEILNKIKNNPEFKDKKITVTGYSLGGNIAGGLSVLNDVEGVTFNSYGDLDKILQQKANDSGKEIKINPEKLINYRHEKDGISDYAHLGTNYTHVNNFVKLQSNIYSNHDIKSLNSAIQRYPNEAIRNKTKYQPGE